MFWSKKEEKGLPNLPPLKPDFFSTPKFPEPREEPIERSLPAFPEPMQKGFSQAAIKTAVNPEEVEEPIEGESENPKTMEMGEWHPRVIPSIAESASVAATLAKKHDVYIRIDRFHAAKKSLEAAKERLMEIEVLLRKIRETKMREEQELSSWDKELSAVKSRVQEVAENIFEKGE